jgi:cation/acetate symporter
MSGDAQTDAQFRLALNRVYRWYAAGFIAFVLVLAFLEQQGLSRQVIGLIFLLATIGLYAGIGHGRRLDVGSLLHQPGWHVVPHGL